ncbi:MAG: NAD(P)-dependent oxidoreductase [bacterium]
MLIPRKRIGFIGPGLMGKGMAKNLIRAGFPLVVYFHQNRKPVEDLVSMGAEETDDLTTLARKSQVIMTVVPGSAEVEEVVLGEKGLIESMKPGKILIDSSTSYPVSTRKIGTELDQRGIHMLDAPLIGSPKDADQGGLNIVVGGDKTIYEQCHDLFEVLGGKIFYVGQLGSGHTIKLINNFLWSSNLAAICQVLTLAAKQGIDIKSVWDVISVSSGNSFIFQTKGRQIINRTFELTFKLATARKDLFYIEKLSRDAEVPLPMADITLQMLDMAKGLGYGDKDISCLVRAWENFVGVEVRGKV